MSVTEQEMVAWETTIKEIQAEMDQHPYLDKGNFPGLDVTLRVIEALRAERAEPRVTVKFEDDTAELLCEALREENHRLKVDRDISVQLGTSYRDEVDRLRAAMAQYREGGTPDEQPGPGQHTQKAFLNEQLNLALKQRDELNERLDEALADSAADTKSLDETRGYLEGCRREKGELRSTAVDLVKKLRYQLAIGVALFRRKDPNGEESKWLDQDVPKVSLEAEAFMKGNP